MIFRINSMKECPLKIKVRILRWQISLFFIRVSLVTSRDMGMRRENTKVMDMNTEGKSRWNCIQEAVPQ